MIYFRGYGWISFLAPLCKLIEALLELAVPLIVARLVDQVMQQAPYQKLLIQGGWMLALAFLGLAFSMMGQYFSAKAATGFANNLGGTFISMPLPWTNLAMIDWDVLVSIPDCRVIFIRS